MWPKEENESQNDRIASLCLLEAIQFHEPKINTNFHKRNLEKYQKAVCKTRTISQRNQPIFKEQTIPVIFKLCKSTAKEENFSIFFKADIITLNLKPARIGTEKEKPEK